MPREAKESESENKSANKNMNKSAASETPKSGKLPVWQILSVVLIIVLAASIVTRGFNFTGYSSAPSAAISADDAANRTVSYINELLAGQATAKVLNVTENLGMYKISLSLGSQVYESYMTKDGKALFPSAYDLSNWTPSAVNPTPSQTTPNTTAYPKSDKPNMQFFVMAFCPYGQQAETGLKGAFDALGNSVDWEPHYVIYDNYCAGGRCNAADYCSDANQTYCSMHGIKELNEDVRQLCIWKYYNSSVWWNYVSAVNSRCSVGDIDTCWLGVANSTGINATKISACQLNESAQLLANDKQVGDILSVQGSPTLFLNGQSYSGGRSPEAIKTALCGAFSNPPASCGTTLSSNESAANGGCGA